MPNIFNNDTTLSKRLRNINKLDITSTAVVSINEFDTAQSIPISSTGQQILNQVSLNALKSLIMETDEEAIVFTSDSTKEIDFHIYGTGETAPAASNIKLQLNENEIRPYDSIIPDTTKVYDLGSKTLSFRDTHNDKLRVFGTTGVGGSSIDLRAGGGYTVQGEGQETPAIFFNTGWYGVIGQTLLDNSEVKRSMIIGTNLNRPTNETTNEGRNNIAFCVYDTGAVDAVGVDTTHEKFRVGQKANYTSVSIIPRNTNCDLGSSTFPYNNTYLTNIITGANQNVNISPNGSGNILLNRPVFFPVGQCIFKNQEANKHFQLNLTPQSETPNDTSDSYGSGLSFWASFFSEADEVPRLFANINCRTTGTNWEGGRLDFRVRVDGTSGTQAGVTGDAAELNSLQMSIYAQSVDIYKNLNITGNIIPATTATYDMGSSTKTINNTFTKTNRVIGNGGYIDLRGATYTEQGQGVNTNPIYFNTGFYSSGTDNSLVRKSMIIGVADANTLPNSRETTGNSRNNIIFCVNNEANANQVNTGNEIMRVGQTAVYLKKPLIPFDGYTGITLGYDGTNTATDTDAGDSWFDAAYITNIFYGSTHQNSDRRLKTNIKNLELGLDIIKQLQPKSYIWKKNNKFDFGVIAQDVLEIPSIKSLVTTRKCGLYSMNYVALIPILVKAIQDVDTKINRFSKGNDSGTVKQNVSMSVVGLDDFKQVEEIKEQGTNNQIRIDTLKMRVDNLENAISDKTNAPTESQIDETRISILEERIKKLETKEHKCEHKCGKEQDEDEESDGNMNVLDLIQQRLHELEKRNTKLELKVKKQTTIINKLLKND